MAVINNLLYGFFRLVSAYIHEVRVIRAAIRKDHDNISRERVGYIAQRCLRNGGHFTLHELQAGGLHGLKGLSDIPQNLLAYPIALIARNPEDYAILLIN